ncbi:MAG: hypothetical protein ABH871_06150 [Pseudomonadota bacterium]
MRSKVSPRIVAAFLFAVLLFMPMASQAGIMDFTKRAAQWWLSRSIGSSAAEKVSSEEEDSEDSGGSGFSAGSSAVPGKCQVPQSPPITQCDLGSGFLCVSTPLGGTADSSFILKGTIDRQSSVLASIKIIAQNEYTKKITQVDTSSPAVSGCWGSASFGRPFCLDNDGYFAAVVELAEEGPYTVSVSATQLTGNAEQRQVRISRVIPTDLSADDIAFDPDVKSVQSVDTSHVTVTVDLLGDCQFCDFIGASTGGVTVTVENAIVNENGEQKNISCATTAPQGGQGRFVVGIPVGSGKNSLTIRACNAASEGSACPQVSGISFSASGVVDVSDSVEFLSPEPLPSYDSEKYPVIPWKFKLGNSDACIEVRFNRQAPIKLCPNSQGVYSIDLIPTEGINVVSLAQESGTDEFAWTFGWGRIISPYASEDNGMQIPSALELGLPAATLTDILIPFINNFLASDERNILLKQIFDGVDDDSASSDNGDMLDLIPHCSSEASSKFSTVLRGEPKIGQAMLKDLSFDQGTMNLSVMLKDIEIGLDLIPQKDLPPLPLVIAFRAAKLDLALMNERSSAGEPLLFLSSYHNDCEYKDGTYCKNKPAPLVPANFIGGANAYGGFIRCDVSLAGGKAVEACNAINSLNAQTGVLSETVLDGLNDVIYCKGSSVLTALARRGIWLPPVVLGSKVLPNVKIPIAVSLKDGIDLSTSGMLVDASVMVGDKETYAQTPLQYHIDSAGIIAGAGFGERTFDAPDAGGDVNIAASLDAVNAFLFAAVAQGDGRNAKGILDFDIHELFFKELDFDFVKECDAYEVPPGEEAAPPTLCHIRPRVSELLGSALTTYGYLPGNHPLLLAVRGNRALGIRVSVDDVDGSLLSVDIGGLGLSFYALEVDEALGTDEYGNPALKLDANGNPIIHSMRPDDPDPLNGQIISFDLSVLLGIEIGDIEPDPTDDSKFRINIKVLGDHSRLVLTPLAGSNTTTVPAAGLVSALAEKLKLALAELEDFNIPVPREIALSADDDGIFGMLGLAKITFDSEDGLKFDLEQKRNTAVLAVKAAITQILHHSGVEKTYEF